MNKEDIINRIYINCKKLLENEVCKMNSFQEYTVDLKILENRTIDIHKRLEVKLSQNGFCSRILLNQLIRHSCNLGEKYGTSIKYYNAHEILDIIELMELGKFTGKKFNRSDALKDKNIYKIHHSSKGTAYSIIYNVIDYWFDKNAKIKNNRINDFNLILNKTGLQNSIAVYNEMHIHANFNKQTGDWLIYAKHNNANYYLCLALHGEGDDYIFENKIKPCYNDFPELLSYL